MKKLASILSAFVLLACGDAGDGSGSTTPTMPTRADLTGAKALFVSSRSGLSRQAVDDSALFMVDASGDIRPVAFTDAAGKAVDLTVSGEVRSLARVFLTFDFAIGGRALKEHTALVELETGKMYDFTGKWVDAAISKKEILYQNNVAARSVADSPLYYWDMNTTDAVPLNNIDADVYDGGTIVPQKNNTIIVNSTHRPTDSGGDLYIYDLTAVNPPERFTGTLFHDSYTIWGIRFREQIPIITLNKTLYSFWINGKDIGVNRDGTELEPLIGADIPDENRILNTRIDESERTFYNYANMYIYKSGVLSIENTPDGEDITYSWTAKDLTYIFDGIDDFNNNDVLNNRISFTIKNGIVYYSRDNTIKVANPKTDDAYSVYFDGAAYGASNVWMVGDDIYFTKYETATNISTYRLNKDETNPTKISSSGIAMQSITELTF